MAKSHSHPFRGFLDMMSEMERVRNLGRTGMPGGGQEDTARTHATAWVPTTDVVAHGQNLVISVEIAGVPPSDIDITVTEGVLTIEGERETAGEEEDVVPYVRERFYGRFRRSMVLPEGVDEKDLCAEFSYGVVTITVPNAVDAPEPEPYRVPISEVSSDVP